MNTDSKTLEVVKPQAASDEQVIAAYRAAENANTELIQSLVFKSAARRTIISGLLLEEKKKAVGHGNWLPWCEKHNIEERTARRYIETAGAACDTLQIGQTVRFDELPLHRVLELPPAELVNSAKEVREKFDHLIEEKSAKEIVVEWKADREQQSKGGSRQIKFTCPHCSTGNKGFPGRTIKCTQCKKKITVKPDGPSAEQKIKEMIEAEQEVLSDLISKLEQWRKREHRAEAGQKLLQQFSDSLVDANREAKKLAKKSRKKT